MLSVMSFEVGTSYNAQSVPYMEGNALCCCKDSANLCMVQVWLWLMQMKPFMLHYGECWLML